MFDNPKGQPAPLSQIVIKLKDGMNNLTALAPSHHTTPNTFIPKDLASAEAVYVWHDTVRGPLQCPYDGPFKVIQREPKFFVVEKNTKHDLRHTLRLQSNTWTGQNAWHESPKRRRNVQKMVILTKESKNFHKSKVDSLQKLSTRACLFYDFLHFKGWPYINHKISLQFEHYFEHFFASS